MAVVCCRVAMQGLGVDSLPLLVRPWQQAVRMRRLLLGCQLQPKTLNSIWAGNWM